MKNLILITVLFAMCIGTAVGIDRVFESKLKYSEVRYALDIQELKQHDELLAQAVKTLSYECDVVTKSLMDK